MVSSSHKTTIPFDLLPEDLLLEISSCVAASSFSDVCTLRLVSKSFQYICNEKYVISRLSLNELPFFRWNHNPQRFSNFWKRCRRSGNPEALYRQGFINYFIDNKKHKGLKFLSEAVVKGNHEAIYVYGIILVCLGGEGNGKENGIKVLSGLVKPLMSKTMKKLVKLREKIRDKIWWRGKTVMKELKIAYIEEKCKCDGQTKLFLLKNCVWHQYGKENDMNTSTACNFCIWHREVKLFFDNIGCKIL